MKALFVLGVLGFGVALAQEPGDGCPPYARSIKLSFTTLDPDPGYNNALNVTSLRDFLRVRGHVLAGRHQRTLGVTSFQVGLSVSGRTYAVPVTGGYCVYLSEVNAEYGYRSHDVFVASEYRPGTCEYNAILDHENQHVAINRATVREAGPALRQELEQSLQTMPPKFTRDPQFGTDRALADVMLTLNKQADAVGSAQARKNAALDSKGNYDAIGELCAGWERGNAWPASPAIGAR